MKQKNICLLITSIMLFSMLFQGVSAVDTGISMNKGHLNFNGSPGVQICDSLTILSNDTVYLTGEMFPKDLNGSYNLNGFTKNASDWGMAITYSKSIISPQRVGTVCINASYPITITGAWMLCTSGTNCPPWQYGIWLKVNITNASQSPPPVTKECYLNSDCSSGKICSAEGTCITNSTTTPPPEIKENNYGGIIAIAVILLLIIAFVIYKATED